LNRSEVTPHLSSGHRVQRARRRHCNERQHPRRPWMDASIVGNAGPGTRRASTFMARYVLQFIAITHVISTRAAGAPRMRDFRLAVVMQLASTGGVEPRPFGLTSNDLTGRCNRGSRTLDTAVMSCLLCPLSYIAVVVKVAFARYTQQHRCSAPVWLDPQPLTRDAKPRPR
jgi:hypothetical protein